MPDLRPLFSDEALRTASRLLQGGRVESFTFFRNGIAGDVVAPNGRVFGATLVLDRAGAFLLALCPCSPALRAGQLCAHVAALVLSSASPEAPGLGAQERFERSLFFLLARAAFDDGDRNLPLAPPPPPKPCVAKEQLLRRLTVTPEEETLERSGARSNQQAWEGSPWYAWAKGWFMARGSGWEEFREVSCEAGRLILRHSEPDGGIGGIGGVLALSPAPSAVGRLLREKDGAFFAARGRPVLASGLTPSFRVALAADETLRLTPVLLSRIGRQEILDRGALENLRFGDFFYLPAAGVFAGVARPEPAFAEPEAPPQASLGFDAGYAPSRLGVPFGRETTVPRDQVVRFLARHKDELARMPPELLSPTLRAAVTAGWSSGATLRVIGGGGGGGGGAERGSRVQLALFYDVSGDRLPFETLLRARRAGQPFLVHRDRLVDLTDDALAWMDQLSDDAVSGRGDEARVDLSALEYLRLRSHLEGPVTVSGPAESLRQLDELKSETAAPAPASLGVPLYDFQEAGYRWLWFLYQNGFGGLLCDDMGLGKTHQALALLEAILRTAPEIPRFLVVCPTSLLPHWEEKVRRYLPELPLEVHHGTARRRTAERGLTLTSYGTLRNDAALFAESTFDVFVLDEIQTLKNRGTATYQALATVPARFALGLTGTPVENRVGDLKNLLDFVLPGYLPGEAAFERRFSLPIEERADRRALARLRRLVSPFVLRRTKDQVLTDLPAKIVDKRTCSLSAEQRELYRAVLAGQAVRLRDSLEEGAAIPYLHVFAVLSRLKQICNHPALVDPEAHGDWTRPSGKWSLFEELLDECLASGLKVVVFSQYVRMLDLFAAYLTSRGIGFAVLKGETVDRAGALHRFRDDGACRVFLASLRAGGLGVDLTAASVVVHYDRWWNQAREDQATDRVHRLGQTRGVQVLKLITQGTLEERIDELIERKALLADDLVPESDPHLAQTFTRDELKALLADLAS